MTDLDELFRPLIEDGARHREPIEMIETRAHARQSRRRSRQRAQYRVAAGFVAVAVVAAVVGITHTGRNGGPRRAGTIVTNASPTTEPAPEVLPGWKSYDYGLARLSVPPDYTAATGNLCPGPGGPILELTPRGHDTEPACLTPGPKVVIAPLDAPVGFTPPDRAKTVNGIRYISIPSHCGSLPVPPSTLPQAQPLCTPSIIVPSLEVEISFSFTRHDRVADIAAILDTLTYSTYARVLQHPFGTVPAAWQTVALGGYEARVPAGWSVVRKTDLCRPVPHTVDVAASRSGAECPLISQGAAPADSAQFRRDDAATTAVPGASVLTHNGLRFTQVATSARVENQIRFEVESAHGRIDITLTLGLDPAVARGILGSLKLP